MKIGKREFDTKNNIYIMGILNVTPDSFSDGGKYNKLYYAKHHVEQMLNEGADIIDIGGESTRPGAMMVSADEELERVIPVGRMIKEEFDVPVSVDTYKSRVAEAVMQNGCDMINDIWGLKFDAFMGGTIARTGAVCCLMHNQKKAEYNDFIYDVYQDLKGIAEHAIACGIPREKIILDPGVGFAKDTEQNLEICNKLRIFNRLGFPVLLGTSRKSFIGNTLHMPVDQRLEGTLATTVMAVLSGTAFVRVHDVEANKRIIQMTKAILDADKTGF